MVSVCQIVQSATSDIKESASNVIQLVRVVKELPIAVQHVLRGSCFLSSSLLALRNAQLEHSLQTTLRLAQVAIKNVPLALKMLVFVLHAQEIQVVKQTFT